MANRDMVNQQFSFEKARKTLNCHCYFGATGAVTLDGPGSKGILAITKITVPNVAGLYTIAFGVSVNGINYVDTYVKSLVLDNVPEIEYSGNNNPAATATLAIFRDDSSNNVPVFGDVAPTQATPVASSGGGFAAAAYKWIVTAVDSLGNETQLATAVATEQSLSPTLNQKVTVSWTALTLAGVIGYNVYRTAASGGTGSENVFVGFAAGAATTSLIDLGTAGTATYQGGAVGPGGSKTPNYLLPAYNFARPPMGYGTLTVVFLSGTTPTAPAAGEGMRIQIELGDSGAP